MVLVVIWVIKVRFPSLMWFHGVDLSTFISEKALFMYACVSVQIDICFQKLGYLPLWIPLISCCSTVYNVTSNNPTENTFIVIYFVPLQIKGIAEERCWESWGTIDSLVMTEFYSLLKGPCQGSVPTLLTSLSTRLNHWKITVLNG